MLTGDYLAELTMLILGRDRMKDANRGYAKTFLRQMEEYLGLAQENGVKIVANAGGLNPAGLADALRELADRSSALDVKIAHVEGDDLVARADELDLGKPLTANAYLGAWGIVECLNAGADVVVTGRVTDASVIVGPAAAHYGWARDDFDAPRRRGRRRARHRMRRPGHRRQLRLLHRARPGRAGLPDRRDRGRRLQRDHQAPGHRRRGEHRDGHRAAAVRDHRRALRRTGRDHAVRHALLAEDGPDRVRISGVRGEAPPPTLKVALNTLGGFRNETTFVLTGLDIEAKAALVREQLEASMKDRPPADVRWTLARTDHADADTEQTASALLHVAVKDADPKVAGRAFTGAAVELALASYPGFHVTAPPSDASPYGVYTAAYVDARQVPHVAVLPDGMRVDIAPSTSTLDLSDVDEPALPEPLDHGPVRRVPLGTIAGARSGDKGGNANLGVWVRSEEAWRWLVHRLTVAEFKLLLPETADLPVTRYLLPNLRAMNFVVEGILGEGVASQARFDPQAKAFGEWLRSREIDVPEVLL